MELNKGMSLPELQKYVAHKVEERGFNTSLHREFILGTEEWGELANELRKLWEIEDTLIKQGVGKEDAHKQAVQQQKESFSGELADCLMYILNIASMVDVNLEDAMEQKEAINNKRKWN